MNICNCKKCLYSENSPYFVIFLLCNITHPYCLFLSVPHSSYAPISSRPLKYTIKNSVGPHFEIRNCRGARKIFFKALIFDQMYLSVVSITAFTHRNIRTLPRNTRTYTWYRPYLIWSSWFIIPINNHSDDECTGEKNITCSDHTEALMIHVAPN